MTALKARRHWAKAGVALTAAIPLLIAACGGSSGSSSGGSSNSSTNSGPPKAGVATGTLTAAMSSGAIDTMDPNAWYFAVTWGLANGLCTTLIRYADQPGTAGTELVPGIASMPTVSSNGLTYTYTLRPGARFSDGQPITPADVKYTYERLMAPAVDSGTGYYFLGLVGAPNYLAGKSTSLPGITTTSNTITFHLTAPDGAFLYKTALPTTCPVPTGTPMKPITDGSLEEKYASGPFKLQSYAPGRQIVMVFNKNYDQSLGVRGHVAKIVFSIGVQSTQAQEEIQAGQLDFQTSNLATADILKISHDPALASQVHTSPRPSITYLFLNNEVPPFNNVDVRKAINYAINRTEILQQWGGPLAGSVTNNIIPAGQLDYKPFSIYPDTPNLAEAKKYMAESGVKTPINTVLRTQNDAPGFMNMAQVIQANLKPLGINVQVVGSPNSVNGSYIGNYKARVPMGIEPWSLDFPDGEAIINTGFDPATPNAIPNLTRFGDKAFIAPFNKAITLQGTARVQAYQQLDYELMAQQAPVAPIFNPRWYDFVSARLGGYVYSEAMDAINYNTLYVKG
ncbi:MAG TPA: ABC transporter substrate-binding protein [Streptosporangiaceae bacterium]|nr:ABC transporter substrate-binding protein [Streptosporangiaceae bacterium]